MCKIQVKKRDCKLKLYKDGYCKKHWNKFNEEYKEIPKDTTENKESKSPIKESKNATSECNNDTKNSDTKPSDDVKEKPPDIKPKSKKKIPCMATTIKNKRCTKNAKLPDKYCTMHTNYIPKSPKHKKSKPPKQPKTKTTKVNREYCKKITKLGRNCTRFSKVNGFCEQHAKSSSSSEPNIFDVNTKYTGIKCKYNTECFLSGVLDDPRGYCTTHRNGSKCSHIFSSGIGSPEASLLECQSFVNLPHKYCLIHRRLHQDICSASNRSATGNFVSNCVNFSNPPKITCTLHSCKHSGCNEIKNDDVFGFASREYCSLHSCYVASCKKETIPGSYYCSRHKCPISGCNMIIGPGWSEFCMFHQITQSTSSTSNTSSNEKAKTYWFPGSNTYWKPPPLQPPPPYTYHPPPPPKPIFIKCLMTNCSNPKSKGIFCTSHTISFGVNEEIESKYNRINVSEKILIIGGYKHYKLDWNNKITKQEIKKEYIRLCFIHHPDKNIGSDGEEFKKIGALYQLSLTV